MSNNRNIIRIILLHKYSVLLYQEGFVFDILCYLCLCSRWTGLSKLPYTRTYSYNSLLQI